MAGEETAWICSRSSGLKRSSTGTSVRASMSCWTWNCRTRASPNPSRHNRRMVEPLFARRLPNTSRLLTTPVAGSRNGHSSRLRRKLNRKQLRPASSSGVVGVLLDQVDDIVGSATGRARPRGRVPGRLAAAARVAHAEARRGVDPKAAAGRRGPAGGRQPLGLGDLGQDALRAFQIDLALRRRLQGTGASARARRVPSRSSMRGDELADRGGREPSLRPAAEKLPSSAAWTNTSISPARLSMLPPPLKWVHRRSSDHRA